MPAPLLMYVKFGNQDNTGTLQSLKWLYFLARRRAFAEQPVDIMKHSAWMLPD
jgi:hypothetical protein